MKFPILARHFDYFPRRKESIILPDAFISCYSQLFHPGACEWAQSALSERPILMHLEDLEIQFS